jgi:hypothetical protein
MNIMSNLKHFYSLNYKGIGPIKRILCIQIYTLGQNLDECKCEIYFTFSLFHYSYIILHA